jgi:hypothetical protein
MPELKVTNSACCPESRSGSGGLQKASNDGSQIAWIMQTDLVLLSIQVARLTLSSAAMSIKKQPKPKPGLNVNILLLTELYTAKLSPSSSKDQTWLSIQIWH